MGPHFDRDGDKISDLIEARNVGTNTVNFRPTIPDTDPSQAVGDPDGVPNPGSLVNGILLPEEGIGYRHFYGADPFPNSDNWGTLQFIKIIEQVGREWNLKHPEGPRISINDLSKRQGGYFGHTSHRNGQDADLRYIRSDGSEGPFSFDVDPIADYNQTLSRELVLLFCKAGIILIYVDGRANVDHPDPAGCQIEAIGGHSDHFHIGIIDWL